MWLSNATRVPGVSAGANVAGAGPKVLHHTSEGSSAAGCIAAVRSSGSWPHLASEWTGGRLRNFQHMSLDVAARALEHPAGTPETNRANVVQIEHVGFTDDAYRARVGADPSLHVSRWPGARWAAIGAMCREIEALTGCPASTGISAARWARPAGWRHDGHAFLAYRGHTAHVFAPSNHHTDGTGFQIDLVLVQDDRPHRTLTAGDIGPDVLALQHALRLRASRCGRPDRMPALDGAFGVETRADAAFVAYVLGIGGDQAQFLDHLSPDVQRLIRDPSGRNATQKRRAAGRRAKHCKGAS
jgi:hypothetical protein